VQQAVQGQVAGDIVRWRGPTQVAQHSIGHAADWGSSHRRVPGF
jgi:hypothetical protein